MFKTALDPLAYTLLQRVFDFAASRGGRNFYMSELQTYVRIVLPQTAPESPGRVLRALRARGSVRYSVVSRPLSLYRMER